MVNGVNEIVQKYAAMVKQRYNPLNIYLYGSYARGEDSRHSDIDIAVVFPKLKESDYMEIFGNLFSLAADVDERLEPNLFIDDGTTDKYSMLYEVKRTGLEI